MNTRAMCAFYAACLLVLLSGCVGDNGVPNNAPWTSAVTCATTDCAENDPMKTDEGVDTIDGVGWSKSGPLITNDPNPMGDGLTMQANFPSCDTYTVQFGITPPVSLTNPTVNGVFGTLAYIYWTVKGNTILRVVSVGNGVSVTGVGEAVKVLVVDDTPRVTSGFGFVDQNTYQAQITVARGSRATTSQSPTYSNGSALVLGPLSNVTVSVPQGFGVNSVMVGITDAAVAAGPPAVIALLRTPLGETLFNWSPDAGGAAPTFVPVPPAATQLKIFNLDAAKSATYTIVWGIDG